MLPKQKGIRTWCVSFNVKPRKLFSGALRTNHELSIDGIVSTEQGRGIGRNLKLQVELSMSQRSDGAKDTVDNCPLAVKCCLELVRRSEAEKLPLGNLE